MLLYLPIFKKRLEETAYAFLINACTDAACTDSFTPLLPITEEISIRSFEYNNYGTGVGLKCLQGLAEIDEGMDDYYI